MASNRELAAQLTALGVPTLHEANHRGGLMRAMRVLVGDAFAGLAETVAIPAGDNLGIHLALERTKPDAVLCVASGGRGLYGAVGELIVEAARVRGLTAVVIEDGVRDMERLSAPPTIAGLGVSARGTIKHRVIAVGQPVGVDGVLVRPGDWVIGDHNGVCVLAADRISDIVARAQARELREKGLREQIRRGIPTTEALGLRRPAEAG